jgi:putative ABC transport system permease protein
MRALDRKLFRDLTRMKGQAIAIALVVASGVALFVATMTMYRSLRMSETVFYREQRFAQMWSGLGRGRAPLSVARDIAALPGVAAVDARLVARAVLDVPDLDVPASAVMLSISPRSGHALNDLYVRSGRHVEPGRAGEVMVSEAFAEKNHLGPGTSIMATVGGHRTALHIVGVALSPEFVMPVEPGSAAPDDQRFGILWIARDQLEALLDMRGSFNDIAVGLAPDAQDALVIAAVDRILAPYGGTGAYTRANQPSHVMLEEHIVQIRGLTLLIPSIFLLVAAFLVNVVLARLIATQREQIGMLKAFGYSNARVALHYLELTLAIVVLGIVLGVPVGAWLGHLMAAFYATFFRFPALVFELEPAIAVGGVAVAVVAASGGALGALRRVVAMPPIVAMTPEVPAFRQTLLDRLGVTPLLSAAMRMIVRNLTKRPLRSGLASAGMAFAVAIVVLGGSSADGLNRMQDVQYQAIQREDISLTLDHPRALGTAHDLLALPGVREAEPYRVVPARVLGRGRHEDIALYGLPDGGVLRNVVDTEYRRVPRLGTGLVLTAWTARRLGLAPGDPVAIEIRENRRRVVSARLEATVDDPFGEAGYMELGALGRLLGEPQTYSNASLLIDPARAPALYDQLELAPHVMAIAIRRSTLEAHRAMAETPVNFVRGIVVVFAVIIAFGVVYNTARIALAERSRELATLRVLGFTRGEASGIMLGEIAILAAPAIPLGMALGYRLAGVVAKAMTGARMHIPLIVSPSTYAFAVLVFAASALISALVVRRRIDRLDLIEVLKARE